MGLYDGAYRMITVVATGGFDPIHSGHIKYLKEASLCGIRLVVGVNSDEWLSRKKGRAFMPFEERAAIVSELFILVLFTLEIVSFLWLNVIGAIFTVFLGFLFQFIFKENQKIPSAEEY